MIGGMPAAPEGHDQPPVRDAGQSPPPPADPYAPWAWTAYPPPDAPRPPSGGQAPVHPGTVYPPPGTYSPPSTQYPPPGAQYPPPGTPYPPPGTVYPPPGGAYVPAGWGGWQQAPPQRKAATRRGGFAGGLVTALAAIAKLGYFGKFGFTALTMVIAVVAYSLVFGWAFAVGLVLIIFVHEMGHFLTSRAMGVPMSAPVFVPFLGAFTTAGRGLTSDRRREAIIAIAGPISGFVATLAVYVWALNQAVDTPGVRFAFSLAYFGFFITLFNLIPILPLDGGRVTSAISKWFNLAGLVILGGLVVSEVLGYSLGNPILILIFIIAVYSVWGRFRAARRGAEAPPLPARTRVLIGAGYVALVAMSGLFMTLSVAWLNAHGLVLN